jgi:hypothetical protein
VRSLGISALQGGEVQGVLTSAPPRSPEHDTQSKEARGRVTPSFESSTSDSAAARRAGEFPPINVRPAKLFGKMWCAPCAPCAIGFALAGCPAIRRRVSKPMAKILCLGFVTTNGGGYPPRVIEAAGILDHLYASDVQTNQGDNLQRKTGILLLVWSLLVFHSSRCVYNKLLGTLPSISEVLERLVLRLDIPCGPMPLKS